MALLGAVHVTLERKETETMKRYVCTVAVGLLLALMGTATASANDLLSAPGQEATQVASFGDQKVEEQENEADVTQDQGNGNFALSPAVAIGGDATATNEQGNGNVAKSDIDQENEVEQSQDSTQKQSLDQSGGNGCCDGQSQAGEQKTYGGDQKVEEQENEADVEQKQGNGNVAISPAIAIFGDAETTNKQGNGNYASSDIDQENEVEQSQDSYQRQSLDQSGSGGRCCHGSSQTGEQKTYGGDQKVEEQENEADVEQKQGNGNVAISPAIAIFGDAKTTNYQGNGNVAKSDIDQENEVEQSQSSTQKQELTQNGGGCCEAKKGSGKHGYGTKECGCDSGSSQTGEQKTSFGDQKVEEQENEADVTQKQGNGNFALSPAIAIGGGRPDSCNSTCSKSLHPHGGNAETANYQGNGNYAKSDIDQENEVEQSQDSYQRQSLTQSGSNGCCGHDQTQTGTQKTYFGDQKVEEQENEADVDQWQGNGNFALSPAVALGGDATTRNYQGNGNVAKSDIDQENEVEQSQDSTQKQYLTQEGGGCCKSKPTYNSCSNSCQPKKEYSREHCGCDSGNSGQSGKQKTYFGDQKVEEQENEADVTQKQGNWNGAISPAVAFGGHQNSCFTCTKSLQPSHVIHGGNATTINKQGNGNYASSDIDQENEVEQSQDAYQRQSLVQTRMGLINR
jgi:hypothetical protein